MGKLTENERKDIFLASRAKTMTHKEMRERWGVTSTTIRNIRLAFQIDSDCGESAVGSEPSDGITLGSRDTDSEQDADSESVQETFTSAVPNYIPLSPEARESPPPTPSEPPAKKRTFEPAPIRAVPVHINSPLSSPVSREPSDPHKNITKNNLFLQDKIKALVESFPAKLSNVCGATENEKSLFVDGLKDLPEERLQSILDGLKYKIGAGGVSDLAFTMVASSTLLIENVAPTVGLQLRGFSSAVSQNEQVRECILEIMADRMSSVVLSPERRLILILLSTAWNINSLNKASNESLLKKTYARFSFQ